MGPKIREKGGGEMSGGPNPKKKNEGNIPTHPIKGSQPLRKTTTDNSSKKKVKTGGKIAKGACRRVRKQREKKTNKMNQ